MQGSFGKSKENPIVLEKRFEESNYTFDVVID